MFLALGSGITCKMRLISLTEVQSYFARHFKYGDGVDTSAQFLHKKEKNKNRINSIDKK